MSNEIENIILEIFRAKLGKKVDACKLHKDAFLVSPFADLGFDSLDKLEFIMEIEDAFHITLNEESISECKNVRNLIELISSAREGSMSDK